MGRWRAAAAGGSGGEETLSLTLTRDGSPLIRQKHPTLSLSLSKIPTVHSKETPYPQNKSSAHKPSHSRVDSAAVG